MNTELRYALACAAISTLSTFPLPAAAGDTKSPTADRKAACAQEARNLKGAEREDFIGWCLKQDAAGARHATARTTGSQQDKMRECNAVAKERTLKGDERRASMSTCLKG